MQATSDVALAALRGTKRFAKAQPSVMSRHLAAFIPLVCPPPLPPLFYSFHPAFLLPSHPPSYSIYCHVLTYLLFSSPLLLSSSSPPPLLPFSSSPLLPPSPSFSFSIGGSPIEGQGAASQNRSRTGVTARSTNFHKSGNFERLRGIDRSGIQPLPDRLRDTCHQKTESEERCGGRRGRHVRQ